MLLASNLRSPEFHHRLAGMLDHLAHFMGSENSERTLDSSKLTPLERCNARASWPTRNAGQLVTPVGQLVVRLRKLALRILDFAERRLLLLDLVFLKGPLLLQFAYIFS